MLLHPIQGRSCMLHVLDTRLLHPALVNGMKCLVPRYNCISILLQAYVNAYAFII